MHFTTPLLAIFAASLSSVLALPNIIAAPTLTPAPTSTPTATCTTTLALHPSMHHDPTTTTWLSTMTVTTRVACGGCELVSREMFGHGPVMRYEATVTRFATVSTETVCAAGTGR